MAPGRWEYRLSDAAGVVLSGTDVTLLVTAPPATLALTVPSPSHGTIMLSTRIPAGRASVLELFDTAGRRLERRELPPGFDGLAPLDTRPAPGLYLVRIEQGERHLVRRVVVLQ